MKLLANQEVDIRTKIIFKIVWCQEMLGLFLSPCIWSFATLSVFEDSGGVVIPQATI